MSVADNNDADVLVVDRLDVGRGELLFCRAVTLTLAQGEICHLIGANGLGKSTMLAQILGILPIVSGVVRVCGAPLQAGHVLAVLHDTGVHEALSVAQNLKFLLALHGIPASDELVSQALEQVGLVGFEGVICKELSAGQLRRVSLARLWVLTPTVTPLWVLDEPLTALDVQMSERLMARIEAFVQQGGAVLMTSHQHIEATKVLDLTDCALCDQDLQDDSGADDLDMNQVETKASGAMNVTDGECSLDDRPKNSDKNSTNASMPIYISAIPLLAREWQVKVQGMGQWLYSLVMFFVIVALFPLSVGSEPAMLQHLAVPIVWIATLLSLVIGMEGLFKQDHDNGTLALLVASRAPLAVWVFIKLALHWLTSAALVAVLAIFAVPFFGMQMPEALVLMLSVLVGSPLLLMLTAIASALTFLLKNGALLIPLIALPMQLPVLIFATGAVERFGMGMNALPILALMGAGSIIAVMVTPFVIAMILRLSWDS